MIEDLSGAVLELASGTYAVQRFPASEIGAGTGRRGVPTACNTAWVASVYQFYGAGSHVRNAAVNPAASFSNAATSGNAGTVANWPFVGGHYHDGATLLWDAIALNPADPAWVPSQPSHYTVGQQRFNGAEVYECIVEGDAAVAGGPAGRSADIVDGTVHWKWLGPRLAAPFNISASFQPLSGRDLDRLPEGLRSKELRKGYTATQLLVAGPNQEPDRVTIDGDVYQVEQVQPWSALGAYWKVVVSKVGR